MCSHFWLVIVGGINGPLNSEITTSVKREQEKKESKKARLCTSMCVLADVLFLIELYSLSGLEPDINHQLRQHMLSTTSH